MEKQNEEPKAPLDHVREERTEEWTPEARKASGSILLVSLGTVIGFMGWLGHISVDHDSDIAVLKDADETTKVHIVESGKKIRDLELNQRSRDTENKIHRDDKFRHKDK